MSVHGLYRHPRGLLQRRVNLEDQGQRGGTRKGRIPRRSADRKGPICGISAVPGFPAFIPSPGPARPSEAIRVLRPRPRSTSPPAQQIAVVVLANHESLPG